MAEAVMPGTVLIAALRIRPPFPQKQMDINNITYHQHLTAQAMVALLGTPTVREGYDDVIAMEVPMSDFAAGLADDAVAIADAIIIACADSITDRGNAKS